MKKYLIEYSKGSLGQPDFQYATELGIGGNMTKNRGFCKNIRDIPKFQEHRDKEERFNFVHEGEFEVQHQWKNFKGDWLDCDADKAEWCKNNQKLTRILMNFKS